MSKQNNISSPQVADPKDVKAGLVSAVVSIVVLMILLFIITYKIADPPPKDVVVTMSEPLVIDEILLKELKIESDSKGGGSGNTKKKGGGGSGNPKEKGGDGDNLNKFGGGIEGKGSGIGSSGGNGGGEGGEGGLGKGDGQSRLRISNASLPLYDIDFDSYIHLQLTVNANGEVVAAKCIKSKTNCTDQRIINQVITEVIRQVKYKKENGAGLVYTFYTVQIRAK